MRNQAKTLKQWAPSMQY